MPYAPVRAHQVEGVAIGRAASYGGSVSRSPVRDHLHEVHTVEDVLTLVREHGGRVTTTRRLLLEALFEGPGHRTAEELAEQVQADAPDVALSTVYRNLDELEKLGVVVHSHLGHGPATYHLAEGAHCHFVCQECGTAVEAPDELFRSLAEAARVRYGFELDIRHFAILGRCAACRHEESP